MSNAIGLIFITVGLAFDVFGCLGLVRLPDVYNRLQASTKCVTLGTCSILFGTFLMVGFTAEYESGEISPYEREIADAQWFDMGHLPQVPDHFTIARRLIDHVVGVVGV